MKTISNALLGAVASTVLSASAGFSETVLTLNSWLPPSHPYIADLIEPLVADIEEVTEGRVTVNVLPAPLGPPPATFDLVKNGVADIGYTVQGYSPGRFKTSAIAEMPFLGDDAVVTSVAFQRVHDAMLAEAGEYQGVKVMAVHTHGPGHVFSTKEISSLDDLSGQKLRTGSVVAHDLAQSFGAVPVEGPSSKAYELLSQKVADGIMFPSESINFFRLNDLLSTAFLAEGGIYNTAFMIVMNENKWNQIPEEDRALIEPLLGEALAARAGEMWNKADAAANETLSESLTTYQASPEDIAALKDRVQPVVEATIALVNETGVDGQAAYDMLQAEIEKLSAQ
ncbi:TRAP transporter substrate-binding protein [Oceanicola sp. D3]|uniref:TRAP transporter substrate-binding protein n=1 Tax=Oceanicola sp. D3 TaxID=2587163 RepID=UPI001120F77C|nr:TRAP transporter substrate-binding protein [Oceanicola sp. D3]QDC10627.1 TRAP transporter substrate-binding protein [Oceanicola sp. D3]